MKSTCNMNRSQAWCVACSVGMIMFPLSKLMITFSQWLFFLFPGKFSLILVFISVQSCLLFLRHRPFFNHCFKVPATYVSAGIPNRIPSVGHTNLIVLWPSINWKFRTWKKSFNLWNIGTILEICLLWKTCLHHPIKSLGKKTGKSTGKIPGD